MLRTPSASASTPNAGQRSSAATGLRVARFEMVLLRAPEDAR